MMRGASLLLFFVLEVSLVWSSPRFFIPSSLRIGSVNEVYVWDEESIKPFSVEVVRPGGEKPFIVARGFSVDRTLSVSGAGGRRLHWSAAWICPDALDEAGPVTVRFVEDGRLLRESPSEILERVFPVDEVPLSPAMSKLRADPDARKEREARTIWALYERFDAGFSVFQGRFTLPVDSSYPHSAEFGDTRRYLYSDGKSAQDYHRGTDFAVPVGTAVSASAPGTVVLVANRMLTGWTIVLEHAPGLYSDYFHLSKILVRQGQQVVAGDRIALSGATGLVTGPHLHWEVRCDTVSVDPFDMVNNGLLDTDGVSAVISSIERSTH